MTIKLQNLKEKMNWKPCPFCGNTELFISQDKQTHKFYDFECLYIGCENCKLEMWTHDSEAGSADYDALVKKANEKWNSRKKVTRSDSRKW